MNELNLTDFFLNAMTTYGPPAFGLALLLSPMGLPIPTALLVVATGAFARQGLIDWSAAFVLGLAATVLGDSAGYALGRFVEGWMQRCVGRRRAAVWQTAQEQFKRYGTLALYATRLFLTALDVPTNLVAGSSRYAFRHFLVWDVAGRATWIMLYGGLGYAFGSQWQAVSQVVSGYNGWLWVVAVTGL